MQRARRARELADVRHQAGSAATDRSRQAEFDEVAVVGVDAGGPCAGKRARHGDWEGASNLVATLGIESTKFTPEQLERLKRHLIGGWKTR